MAGGLDPDAFWRQTPRLLSLVFKGRAQLRAQAHNGRAWLAWHAAYLPNMKQAVKLEKLLLPVTAEAPKPRRKTRAELEAIAMQWHAALSAKAPPPTLTTSPQKRSRDAATRSRREPRRPPGAG